jgi:hypothetical protein
MESQTFPPFKINQGKFAVGSIPSHHPFVDTTMHTLLLQRTEVF